MVGLDDDSSESFFIALSRGDLLPNPDHDQVECIFYALQEDDVLVTDPAARRASYLTGCFAIESRHVASNRMRDNSVRLFESELELFNAFVDQVQEWDPDVFSGWELQNGSWGYLAERIGKTYGKQWRGPLAQQAHHHS